MINLIGAYIFTVWIAMVVVKRREIGRLAASLDRSPSFVKLSIAALLAWMAVLQSALVDPRSVVIALSLPQFLLDGLTLWMHEAGHIYWAWLGSFFRILGGTLNEILVPLLLAFLAFKRRNVTSLYLSVYWLGFNLFDVARYAADAQERQLELLGGSAECHDWGNLLQMTGLLSYDSVIGAFFAAAGAILAVGAILLLITDAAREKTFEAFRAS